MALTLAVTTLTLRTGAEKAGAVVNRAMEAINSKAYNLRIRSLPVVLVLYVTRTELPEDLMSSLDLFGHSITPRHENVCPGRIAGRTARAVEPRAAYTGSRQSENPQES
jgi:hypothetical protein